MNVLVCGAGGFIGGHLVRRLLDQGHTVRAVDIKPAEKWWQRHKKDRLENRVCTDLRRLEACRIACGAMGHGALQPIDYVYQLAADMGGIGFIESHKLDCSLNSLINTHMLMAAAEAGVRRIFYSSSACVYAAAKQDSPDLPALKEADAYPAMPEDGYGWEKLFSERMYRHFMEETRLECRVARFHNIYGPEGSWNDGTEKAPAAICRKVAEAKLHDTGKIDIWGDGTRTRSFTWIDDCLDGIQRIMASDVREPLNLGSSERVTINQLVDLVEQAADYKVRRKYDLTKAQGVHGRNSDNTLIRERLRWEPSTSLRDGIARTYEWVEAQVRAGTESPGGHHASRP